MTLRLALAPDVGPIGQIAQDADLFPAELAPGMVAPFLEGGAARWLVAEDGGRILGFCYLEPERLTDRTWNMLALAVAPDMHRRGTGRALVQAAEALLRRIEGRLLIVETAGTEGFGQARAFYTALGFEMQARITDFYEDGTDKVVFCKRL